LERKRRCGFLPQEQRGAPKLIWARGRASADECPKTLITAASLEMLETFYAWKFAGWSDARELRAREADAFLILEQEWRAEQKNGQ
jgi:hypothetical protein